MLDQCAKAGLKSYAPYTVNPSPYDVYNVNNNPTDMQLIYEGYVEQRDSSMSALVKPLNSKHRLRDLTLVLQ